ncbi:cytochrome b5-like heme/steroid binding domain-containing protein [Kalaharituber pfeilii]|nr:cytochrome b5-like heme/steroid binding domain-containing protein [Kalaharituber pfeilii]
MPHQPPPPAETQSPNLHPLNLLLLSIAIYIAYLRLRPTTLPTVTRPPPIVYKRYTPLTLLPYNGIDKPQVYLAVSGKVFDVTSGKAFYGPGGPYENFAGHDASRGLAKGSFESEMLTDPNGKIDGLEDLTEEERNALREWEGHFGNKYAVVGELVENGEAGENEEEEVQGEGVKR